MRAIRRFGGKWQVVAPPDLYKWLCQHDGGEALVVDDATRTYYCATEDVAQGYRDRWSKELRQDDPRRAVMFFDLAVSLGEAKGAE